MSGSGLIGRGEEVAVLDDLLADRRAEPRALLIEGDPGIGKTTLLHRAVSVARAAGYPVVSCRPTRSEMDLSYAALVELLGAVDPAVLDALPAPLGRALRVLLRQEDADATVDRLSLGMATVAAVRALAEAGPVLLAVDDAQWLDRPSAEILAYVVRRLAGSATRIVVIQSEGAGRGWRTELARAVPEGRLDTLRLGPLEPSDLSRILRRTLGWAPAWPHLVRIAELSAGNPLYALELARASGTRRSSAPGDDGERPAGPIDLARSRIARLPGRIRAVVELAAVPRAPTRELLRRLDPSAADLDDALDIAVRRGILTVDGGRVRFGHPILAAAAYAAIPPGRRQRLHRAAARLAADPEERARHLATAATGPDPKVAAALDDAAEQAWRRGAPDASADLLRLACRLTDPADADALARRRTARGRLLYSAGDAPAAVAELEELAAGLPPGLARARVRYHLMYLTRLSGAPGRAVEHGRRAVTDAEADPSLQAEVYELLSRISDDDVAGKLDAARAALRALGRVADPDPEIAFYVHAALVEAEFYAGLGIHLDRLAGLSPGTRQRFPPVRAAFRGDDLIGRLLAYDGHVDDGLATLRGMYERAAVESRPTLPAILGWMAEAQIMAGRFADAAALTREAIDRAEEIGATGGTPWEVGFHALALAMLGRLGEAEAAARRVLESADPLVGLDYAPARLALGVAALARDRPAEAVAHLRHLDRAKRAAGIREPRVCAHAPELIEALVGAGELAEADEVLARLAQEADTSGGQWARAVAYRGRALVEGARGALDEALDSAERSLAAMAGLPVPFERARTLLVLGQLRRRRKDKQGARQALVDALAVFDELGTPVWAERVRAELARVPQHRADAGLTPTEERIARLAGEGLSNREIADRVFVTPKTVEVNLTRIYRKLGVRSRTVLAHRLAGDAASPPP